MAHLITGIDLGSHAVKFVCIEAGFRKARVRAAFEQLVEPGESALAERQAAALTKGLAKVPGELMAYAALDGDRLAVRRLQFPIADVRKVESAIPFELEGEIAQPLESVVFDFELLPPGSSPEEATRVLAVAAGQEDVGAALERFKAAGVEPRSLYAAPLIYRFLEPAPSVVAAEDMAAAAAAREDTLVAQLPTPDVVAAAEAEADTISSGGPPLRLLLDMGAARTNLVVLEAGRPVFSRTVLRGGNHLTLALAEAFGASFEQAEAAKCTRGAVAHAGFVAADAVEARMAEVLRASLAPLLRDVRQTLASYHGLYHRRVERLSVVGGCSALRGLAAGLAEALDMKLVGLETDRSGFPAEADELPLAPPFALAEAIAWAGVRGARVTDLRKGPFVYRASFSVVRQKAWHLAALAAAVVMAVVVDGAMAYTRLHQENEKLESELAQATRELFGAPDGDAASVARLLKRGFREEMPPIPALTAYDILNEVSRRLPSKEKIKLDLLQLDIRPKKIFLKGTIDSVASVDEMVGALKEIDCFEEITKGAITEVSGGEKQFTLNVKSTCP
ncbi:MAG: pilus assembly protein PilM [Myxococcales bacterium]|nr:pilus assembly protein PilM [Myxococcales bacterium]